MNRRSWSDYVHTYRRTLVYTAIVATASLALQVVEAVSR